MNKSIIIAIVSFTGGTLLFVGLVLLPLFHAIRKDSVGLEAQYVSVLQASSAETEAIEFLSFSQAQEDSFEKITNVFVDAETPIGFIRFVEEIASATNLEVKITPGLARQKHKVPWPAMDFQLASKSTYPTFLRFLEKLENGPYLVSIKNTTMNRDLGSAESAKSMNFTLLIEVSTGLLPESTL